MKRWIALLLALVLLFSLSACSKEEVETAVEIAVPILTAILEEGEETEETEAPAPQEPEREPQSVLPQIGEEFSLDQVPEFTDQAYVAINGNQPYFTAGDMTTESYEFYSELDELGRCGVTMACVGQDIMPEDDRGEIGQVKPTGWQSVKYDIVEGKYLYNRCHLIGFQLTGENANRGNLITGTRYLNIDGMLPFENMVADFVQETGEHVLYRVTPIFVEDELVARGVLMEGWSVEDEGESVCFCVYAYNAQPGVIIDYATGESRLAE